jgi:uncharacterized damage-inducible protein DinB
MFSIEALCEFYDYNYWARDRQLEACAKLTAEQLSRPLGSSFSSLRETLAHLVMVEWVWHERWCGRDVRSVAFEVELTSVEALRARWQMVERDVRGFVSRLTNEDLARPLTYVNFKGETWTYALGEALLHLVNHQTYHRGQVTTLLRQLGSPAPAIDFLVYLDGKS